MFETGIRLNHLSMSQLNHIIHGEFDETEISCFLFDASSKLLLSFPDKKEVMSEITQIGHEAAIATLKGETYTQQSVKRCLTEVIQHQGQTQGVLVGWIQSPQQASIWPRIMRTTRQRIEDLLATQEEIDELSLEILNDYRELGLIHTLSTQLAGLSDMNLVYNVVLKHIIEIVKAKCGYIFKLDKATDGLDIVQQYPHLTNYNALFPVQLGKGFIGKIAQTGESILIEDDTHPLWDAELDYPFTPPLMGCALQIGKNFLGAIVVAREVGSSVFKAGDLKILESAAQQSASAMMNVSYLEDLKKSEEKFRKLFEQSNDAIFIRSFDGKILDVNSRACEMLGYDADQLRSMTVLSFLTPADFPSVKKAIQIVNETGSIRFESRYQKADRTIIDVEISSRVIDPKKGVVQAIIRDITRQKQMEKDSRHNALHDALTKLPNRTLFLDRLEQAIERVKIRKGYLFAVLVLDLDRFKVVNDSLGHTIGDQLLVEVAHRLKDCIRLEDTVARLGGDEFTILLDGIRDVDDVMRVVGRIHEKLELQFDLNGHEVFTTASIGVVLSQTSYDQPESVLRDADLAMYRAKAHGNPYEVFNTDMYTTAMERLRLETGLRWALERDEFRLYYQPILSLKTGKIKGFEALIRWQHPDGDLVPPGKFIPVAEETGIIIPIGQWVLREACSQISVWQAKFPDKPDLAINVNLSTKQLMQSDIVEQVEEILRETGIHPHCLNLEITESVIMDNPEAAAAVLSQLKAMNLQVQMDDFGTGYSSLSYLHHFPIDVLKIDRSFVSQMEMDSNSKIIQTIVTLAHNLDIEVTAEGIETIEQLSQLKVLACEAGQGYYFSKPLPVEEAEALIVADIHGTNPWSCNEGLAS